MGGFMRKFKLFYLFVIQVVLFPPLIAGQLVQDKEEISVTKFHIGLGKGIYDKDGKININLGIDFLKKTGISLRFNHFSAGMEDSKSISDFGVLFGQKLRHGDVNFFLGSGLSVILKSDFPSSNLLIGVPVECHAIIHMDSAVSFGLYVYATLCKEKIHYGSSLCLYLGK